jgi:hypothetical protein
MKIEHKNDSFSFTLNASIGEKKYKSPTGFEIIVRI